MTPDYTGLGAMAWELYSSDMPGPDVDYFRQIIAEKGTPALDVGCATGRILLPCLQAGLEVDGVEPSEDMLVLCRRKAAEQNLHPALFRQSLQTLDLPRRYRTILIPCGTLMLVTDDEELEESLRRLYRHLEPGGLLLVTAYVIHHDHEKDRLGEWHHRATRPLPDGTELTKHACTVSIHWTEQRQEVQVRYRRHRGEEILEEQLCDAPERWFYKSELTLWLERHHFQVERVEGNYTSEPANDSHHVLTFFARKPA